MDVNSLCPHSTTWFNQERYADDIATWGASPNAGKIQLVKLSEVQEYVNQHVGKDIHGWAASFFREWQKRRMEGNDVPIDWKIELSKQLNIWRKERPE